MIASVFRDVFKVNLGVKSTERCLVFTDSPSPCEESGPLDSERRTSLRCLAYLASEVGKGIARDVRLLDYPATCIHGAEPPAALWEAAFGEKAVAALRKQGVLDALVGKNADDAVMLKAEKIIARYRNYAVDAVVALSFYSTSHTLFRKLLTGTCGTRYASMPLFDMPMLEGPMSADWKEVAGLTRAVTARVNRAERVEISTPNGTRLSFSILGRKALSDTGLLTRPGSFGNLPGGESFVAPLEGTARGTLVLEWGATRELASPLTLTVLNGAVMAVAGKEPYADYLRDRLAERPENANIAEFGIGTNNRAQRPDNILESEKIKGTVHIALGDNSTFGGIISTPFHQDFVFFKPTVRLVLRDGTRELLMKDGSFRGVRP